jgi:hypothetical protein
MAILTTMAPFGEILIFGALLAFLLAMLSVSHSAARSFQCPVTGRKEIIYFERALLGGRFLDVKVCSAFTQPSAVTCSRSCLDTAAARSRALRASRERRLRGAAHDAEDSLGPAR